MLSHPRFPGLYLLQLPWMLFFPNACRAESHLEVGGAALVLPCPGRPPVHLYPKTPHYLSTYLPLCLRVYHRVMIIVFLHHPMLLNQHLPFVKHLLLLAHHLLVNYQLLLVQHPIPSHQSHLQEAHHLVNHRHCRRKVAVELPLATEGRLEAYRFLPQVLNRMCFQEICYLHATRVPRPLKEHYPVLSVQDP